MRWVVTIGTTAIGLAALIAPDVTLGDLLRAAGAL